MPPQPELDERVKEMLDAQGYKEQAKNVADVMIIDDHTVKLVTTGPNPILPNQLTSIYMMDSGWSEANNVAAPQDFKAKEETFAVRNANGTCTGAMIDGD